MKIPTEGKMDFDNSISTEGRFALRHWLEQLINALNYNDQGVYLELLDESLIITGFSDESLNKEGFLARLQQRAVQNITSVTRFPELKVSFERGKIQMTGSYEEYLDGVLSFQGDIKLEVAKQDNGFTLTAMRFDPRMRLAE